MEEIQLCHPCQSTSCGLLVAEQLENLWKRNGGCSGGSQCSQETETNHTADLQVQALLVAPLWERFCPSHLPILCFGFIVCLHYSWLKSILTDSKSSSTFSFYPLLFKHLSWSPSFLSCNSWSPNTTQLLLSLGWRGWAPGFLPYFAPKSCVRERVMGGEVTCWGLWTQGRWLFVSHGVTSVLGLCEEHLWADASFTNDLSHQLFAIFLRIGVWCCTQCLVLRLAALSGMCTEGGKRQQSQQDRGGTGRNAGWNQGNKQVLRETSDLVLPCLTPSVTPACPGGWYREIPALCKLQILHE